ncbi:hypothetical protein DAEQUDRAFT_721827 [Daedalea quercina L-15889]|uniref:Uncharacterized protein n=1 Tax=Daedalea quercina L-15889 TaxID=1314783 RepID=A0A165TCL8_9APHY|nr:hypothetical protein DAEQUDRAFT_721827 [Daedalea quercina L-15889]
MTTARSRIRPRPRPILKRDSYPTPLADDSLPFTACDYIVSPRVHFPPTPHMASLRFTHSPNTYDRAPILVSPNSGCLELPKRGERRFYSPPANFDDSAHERRGRLRSRTAGRDASRDDFDPDSPEGDVKGSYFHPRAFEACAPEPLEMSSPPILIPDLSPSEESDDSVATPPDRDASAMVAASIAIRNNSAFMMPPSASGCDAPPNPGARRKPRSSAQPRPCLKRKGTTVTFASPDLDEGCLGGF